MQSNQRTFLHPEDVPGNIERANAPGPCSCTFDCECLLADLNSASYTSEIFRSKFQSR